MEENEEYLGGISSPYLKKGVLTGYGIYATNMRIFGIKDRKAGVGWLAGAAVGGLAGGGAGGVAGARGLSEKMSKEQNTKTISELMRARISK